MPLFYSLIFVDFIHFCLSSIPRLFIDGHLTWVYIYLFRTLYPPIFLLHYVPVFRSFPLCFPFIPSFLIIYRLLFVLPSLPLSKHHQHTHLHGTFTFIGLAIVLFPSVGVVSSLITTYLPSLLPTHR